MSDPDFFAIREMMRETAINRINSAVRKFSQHGRQPSMRSFHMGLVGFFVTLDYGNDDMLDFIYIVQNPDGSAFMGWYNGGGTYPVHSFYLKADESVGEFTNKLVSLLSYRDKSLFSEQESYFDVYSARKYLDQIDANSANKLLKAAGIDADRWQMRFDRDEGGTTIVFKSNTFSDRPYEFVSINTGKHTELSKPLRVIIHKVVDKDLCMLESDKSFGDGLSVGELVNHIRDTTTRFRNAAREL